MDMINSTTARVDNFADLVTVLTANSEITYVYLNADIPMTSGIQIHNDRTLITIDGEYPQGSGIFHTLTDAGGDLGMIYKSNISSLDITFQNMTITGRNYFGMPRIADGNTNVTITYNKVTYTGPQITWHWSGKTRYIDCDITIMYAGVSPAEEIAQVCQVEMGGKTKIQHNSTGFEAFHFYKSNASFTILEDADVEITATYDFFTHEYPPALIIQPRASFTLTTQRGISRSGTYRLSSFLVDQGATFRYTQLSNSGGDGALYINGAFTVNSNATVYMQADFASTIATKRLVQFTTASADRGLYLNNPKSFVLYNRGIGTAIYFSAPTPFEFDTEQVNYWRDAGLFPTAGTFDDPPLYPWRNPDWSEFNMKGSATTNATTVTSTTLLAPVSPDLSNLKLHEARVLSVGYLPLTVKTVVDDQTPVKGSSDPYANIKVEYTVESVNYIATGKAGADGTFSIPTPTPIPLGVMVTVSANVPFLYKILTVKVEAAGELHIVTAPERIEFKIPCLSVAPQIIMGRDNNIPVVVSDTRVYSTKWELTVTIDGPMHCEAPVLMLPGEVVFVNDGSTFVDMGPLVQGVPKRVYVGGPYIDPTSVAWANTKGILLHLTGPIQFGKKYIANIEWTVNPIET